MEKVTKLYRLLDIEKKVDLSKIFYAEKKSSTFAFLIKVSTKQFQVNSYGSDYVQSMMFETKNRMFEFIRGQA